MDGLLLIDKPIGWSSFDVVKKIRNVSNTKVGHTGTLDPLASGLLVLTIGKACKLAQNYSKLDKSYETTVILGEKSTTGDNEGVKTAVSTRQPSVEEVKEATERLTGEITQTVPAYSAVKIDGKRAYKLAREGKKVEMPSRKVKIYGYEDFSYKYPEVKFSVRVSSGTYIRSLAEDLGQILKTGAYLGSLRRTEVGTFSIDRALPMEGINLDKIEKNILTLENQG